MDSDTQQRIHALSLVVQATRDFQAAVGKRKSLPIRQALYDFWENRDFGPRSLNRPEWTPAARDIYCKTGRKGDVVYDHAVPLRLVVDDLLATDLDDLGGIKRILDEKLHIRLISQEEDTRLREAGLRQTMPTEYDDPGSRYYGDPLARYRKVGIDLGDDGHPSASPDVQFDPTRSAPFKRSDMEDTGYETTNPSIDRDGIERRGPSRHPDQEQFVKGLVNYLGTRDFWPGNANLKEVRNVTFQNVARIENINVDVGAGMYFQTQEWRAYIYIKNDPDKTAVYRLQPYLEEITAETDRPLDVKTGRTGRTHYIQCGGVYTSIDDVLFQAVYTNLRVFCDCLNRIGTNT